MCNEGVNASVAPRGVCRVSDKAWTMDEVKHAPIVPGQQLNSATSQLCYHLRLASIARACCWGDAVCRLETAVGVNDGNNWLGSAGSPPGFTLMGRKVSSVLSAMPTACAVR